MVRHSKIQKEVLLLYREFLRLGNQKPGINTYMKKEFKKNSHIPRTESLRIEYLIRQGRKQLDMLKMDDVQSMGVFVKDEDDKKK
jgi:succinate dehydrogenase assembly factor 1